MRIDIRRELTWGFVAACWLAAAPAFGASPTAEQALRLTPAQKGVDYDRPTGDEASKCAIKQLDARKGWIIESPTGMMLRKFVDTNDDNIVDQWSYFKDGLEVYRDIDVNFNGRPDQFRWFNTAGGRWALDANEDGVIDAWKAISAEEVTAEAVAAIGAQDVDRFARLLLTADELKSLGLGATRAETLTERIGNVGGAFKTMATQQKTVTPDSNWVQFSAGRPGIVPSGADGSTKDVRVYENVTAIVETGGKHSQVQIGTLVQVGDVWRLIDAPQPVVDGQTSVASTGFFFQPATPHRDDQSVASGGNDAFQKLLGDLEALDREINQAATAKPEEQARLTVKRAELLGQIAAAARTPEDRAMWVRQLADMILAAVQSGACPDGAERLSALLEKNEKSGADKNLAAYIKLRQLTAAYALSWQAPKADFSKIQAEWLKNLEQFITDYPTAPETAEAMLQLASAQDLMGQDEDAKKWYGRIVKDFPESQAGKKARGAVTRLESVGKVLAFNGMQTSGKPLELSKLQGKAVLIQYWATWSPAAKADMAALKELVNKYGRSFTIIGVCLDSNVKELKEYLAENPLPWFQVYEEGGLDSRPANALGILTVPTMILVDPQGKVVDRNITVADLEGELKKIIR